MSTKKRITDKTRVKIYNNTGGKTGFKSVNNQWYNIPKYGAIEVRYEDLVNLFYTCPNHLNQGYIYIADKDVRDKLIELGMTDKMILQRRHFEHYIKNKDVKELRTIIKGAEEWMRAEFGTIAYQNRDSLTYEKLKLVQELTGVTLLEDLELDDK